MRLCGACEWVASTFLTQSQVRIRRCLMVPDRRTFLRHWSSSSLCQSPTRFPPSNSPHSSQNPNLLRSLPQVRSSALLLRQLRPSLCHWYFSHTHTHILISSLAFDHAYSFHCIYDTHVLASCLLQSSPTDPRARHHPIQILSYTFRSFRRTHNSFDLLLTLPAVPDLL